MQYDLISQKQQDIGRGTALLASGAMTMLLMWVLPFVAPLALAAYGLYRLYRREVAEGLVGLGIAVVLWFLRPALGWLLWLLGAGMVGFGLFFLVRGIRTPTQLE